MIVRLDYKAWCKVNNRNGWGRKDWKPFMCDMAAQHGLYVIKTPKGNGTHIDIGDYHFQATSNFHLYVASIREFDVKDDKESMAITINYSNIRYIDYDTESRLIVINGRIAIK